MREDHRSHLRQPRRRHAGAGRPEEDPTGGFTKGGWATSYFDDVLRRHRRNVRRPFDLLLRRKTYDIFAAHWPYVTDDRSVRSSTR